jgi:aldehyde dehydrogenase (NAD+)
MLQLMNAERQLIESMRSFFEKGDTRPEAYRREQLKKLRSLLEEHRAEIEAALKADLRKPAFEAETSEIGVTISEIDHALSSLSRWMKPRRVPTPALLQPASSLVRSEPLGVVLVIAPWNYPVNLLLSPLVGALAAGNCVVLKPSELAPTVSAVMTKLLNTAYPAELVRVVEGGKDETTRLLELPFDHIFYTGSTPVGRVVMEAAAKNLVPVTLELGGKSPCIVCEDADLAVSARRIAWGKFTNAGQTCVAPDYVLAHATVKDALITELGRAVEELWGTDPQKSPDYGRVINERHFRRLEALLTSGRAAVGGRGRS